MQESPNPRPGKSWDQGAMREAFTATKAWTTATVASKQDTPSFGLDNFSRKSPMIQKIKIPMCFFKGCFQGGLKSILE